MTLTNEQREAILPLIDAIEKLSLPATLTALRGLDGQLSDALGHGDGEGSRLISLDNAIPGENITRVEFRRDNGDGPPYWEATHHCANGVSVTGRGQYEAAARRAAGLRGLLLDGGKLP